jgi:hypothetical protein
MDAIRFISIDVWHMLRPDDNDVKSARLRRVYGMRGLVGG